MTVAIPPAGGGALPGRPGGSGLADVIDTILDKGLVIDAYVRVSLVGIEVLTIDARIVVASVDTYLRFAEAVNRLDLSQTQAGLTDLVGGLTGKGGQGQAAGPAAKALETAGEKLHDLASGYAEEPLPRPRRRREED